MIDDSCSFQNSLMTSKRSFQKIAIRNLQNTRLTFKGDFLLVIQILKKFENRIESLAFFKTCCFDSEIISLLELLGKVVEISFLDCVLIWSKKVRSYIKVKLLKSVTAHNSYLEKADFLNFLPPQTITKFHYKNYGSRSDQVEEFLMKQNIVDLVIYSEISFNNLNPKHLTIRTRMMTKRILNQLHYLNLEFAEIDDETFSLVCNNNAETLQDIKVHIKEISPKSFENIKKLESLEKLELKTFKDFDEGHLKVLSSWKSSMLKELSLIFYFMEISDRNLIEFSKNFNRLKNLKIEESLITNLRVLMENFPILESLSLCYRIEPEDLKFDENFTKISLKKFEIHRQNGDQGDENLFKLLKILPNLEELKIIGSFTNDVKLLKNVFKFQPKLKILRLISWKNKNFEKFLRKLNELGKKLDCLELNVFQSISPQKLLSIFDHRFRLKTWKDQDTQHVHVELRR